MTNFRVPNTFERILLIIGILIIITGYALISRVISVEGFNANILIAIFLWLALICMIVMTATTENMKEEMKIVIENQLEEIKLLRDDIKKHP